MASTPRTNRPRRVWDRASVEALGATTDVETAGEILGCGRTTAYELAAANEFPVPMLRIGKKYRIPVDGILATVFPATHSNKDAQ